MHRWHQEETLMFRRWKMEMENHSYDWRCPPTGRDVCHCTAGIGSMRKRTPNGHHKHCLMCNYSKYLYKKQRRREKYREIAFELNAY